jgi:hypothetical protein
MAILDTTALSAVLKVQYTQPKVNNLCYPESPVFAKMQKRRDFFGSSKVVAFQYGSPQGRGAAFSVGLGNVGPSGYANVTVTRAKDYAFAQLGGEAVDASRNDAGALLNGMKKEIDNTFYTIGRSIGIALFQNGGGARGQIDPSTTLASTTLVLKDKNSVVNFEKGMILNLSATDGTTGAKKAGTLTIVGVDRGAGTLTLSGNISTGVATAALNDFIFQNGDFETTKSLPTGIAGWIPKVAPVGGDNFFGLDRSVDATRLAGLRYTASAGGPIEETLIQAAARLVREGGKPDVVAMNPLDYANLIVQLGSKVIYDRLGSSEDPAFGFDTVKLMGPRGPIMIVPEYNVTTGDAWMLTMSTWSFETLLDGPRILNLDGNDLRADPTTDSYILRIGYYGQFVCDAPGWNSYVAL